MRRGCENARPTLRGSGEAIARFVTDMVTNNWTLVLVTTPATSSEARITAFVFDLQERNREFVDVRGQKVTSQPRAGLVSRNPTSFKG
jgi:hypothetical protein